jgi:hypothetical protein
VAFFEAVAFAFLGAVVLDAVFARTGFWVVSVILLHLYI